MSYNFIEALKKICEITAFFDIALIAALITIYAIILSVKDRLVVMKTKIEKITTQESFEKDFLTIVTKLDPDKSIDSICKEFFGKPSIKKKKELISLGRRLSHPWILTTGILILISLVLTLSSIIFLSNSLYSYSLIPVCVSWLFLVVALCLISLTLRQVSILAGEPLIETNNVLSRLENEILNKTVNIEPSLEKLNVLEMPGNHDIFFVFSQRGNLNRRIVLTENKKEPITMIIWSNKELKEPLLGIHHPSNVSIYPLRDLKFLPKETREYPEKNTVSEVRVIPILPKSSITLIPLIIHCQTKVPFHISFTIANASRRKPWTSGRLMHVEE
jgi:hypothetical protein